MYDPEQLAAVGRSMVRRAQRQEIRDLVVAAFGAWMNMVHVDEHRVVAARNAAAVFVAREHGTSQRGRDAFLGARPRTGVGGVGSVGLLRRSGVRGRLVPATARRAHAGLARGLTVEARVLIGHPGRGCAPVLVRTRGSAPAQLAARTAPTTSSQRTTCCHGAESPRHRQLAHPRPRDFWPPRKETESHEGRRTSQRAIRTFHHPMMLCLLARAPPNTLTFRPVGSSIGRPADVRG